MTRCQCCERLMKCYWNDTPEDVPLAPEEAARRGLSDDAVVEWPGPLGFTVWGIVRVAHGPLPSPS